MNRIYKIKKENVLINVILNGKFHLLITKDSENEGRLFLTSLETNFTCGFKMDNKRTEQLLKKVIEACTNGGLGYSVLTIAFYELLQMNMMPERSGFVGYTFSFYSQMVNNEKGDLTIITGEKPITKEDLLNTYEFKR